MDWFFRFFLILTLAATLFIAKVQHTYACSCARDPEPRDALAKADAVFVGRVIAIMDTNLGPVVSSADPLRNTFEISQTWKGTEGSEITITSERFDASCGYAFQQGREYIVYASAGGGGLRTSICSRTAALDRAQADLVALGAGTAVAPASKSITTITPILLGACQVAAVIGLLVFGSGLVMVKRRAN
jgi:hypothetical protein